MPLPFIRTRLILAGLLLMLPHRLSAQVEDTTIWQETGRHTFRDWAQRDSAVARTLFRNLKRSDYRFLNVPDYGDGAIGLYTPAHDSALARYGVRMYADSDLTDEAVRAQEYYEPYHFADYYNRALFNFVQAPESDRNCFLAQGAPYGGCRWTPLPPPSVPPAERALARVDSTTLMQMLDAVLATALARTGANGPVALEAEYGWDGVYSLARKGRHPDTWLRAVARSHLVTCILHSNETPVCPTSGSLTTIALNQPRALDDSTIVIYTTIRTVMIQEAPPHTCGFGCFWGQDYDARLEKAALGYRAEPLWVGYLN